MSAQIDVLAVLDECRAGLHSVASNCRTDLSTPMRERAEAMDAARAAVAELIAAASDPAVHVRGNGIRGWQRHCEAVARLRTALANAGGAK